MSRANEKDKHRGFRRWRRHAFRRFRNCIVGALGPFVADHWTRSLRLRCEGARVIDGRLDPQPAIYAFWHRFGFVLGGLYKGSGTRAIVSDHGDGEMMARLLAGLGMYPVRGSTTRNATRVLLGLLRAEGEAPVAVATDGPRGPAEHLQQGAVFLASRLGLPIIPTAVAMSRHVSLPTWDRFVIPFPFTRTLVYMGEPLVVAPKLRGGNLELERQRIEKILREHTDRCERNFEAMYRAAPAPEEANRARLPGPGGPA